MKLALNMALASSLTLFGCAENGRAESPQQGTPDMQTSQDPKVEAQNSSVALEEQDAFSYANIGSDGVQTGNIDSVFHYNGQYDTGPSLDRRFSPARALEDVEDADLIDIFLALPHTTTVMGDLRLIVRQHDNGAACASYEHLISSKLGQDTLNAIFNPYPSAFYEEWLKLRLDTAGEFGRLVGLIIKRETNTVVGYIEQSHIGWVRDWSRDTPKAMISSAPDDESKIIRATTVDLDLDTYAEFLEHLRNADSESKDKRIRYCRLAPPLSARRFFRDHQDRIENIVGE